MGVRAGTAYGSRPLPDGVEPVVVDAPVGPLTALRAVPPGSGEACRGHVLVVPGYTGSKEDHRLLLPALAARGYEAVAFSQRGQADSVHPETAGDPADGDGTGEYALATLAHDVVDVVEALGWSEPVHLVGHSFGGVVAAEAALEAQERWATLTLLCSGPHGWPTRLADHIAVLEESGSSARLAELRSEAAEEADGADPGEDEQAAFEHRRMLDTSPAQLLAAARHLRDHVDRSAELRRCGVPLLVAHGEHDEAWPHAWQRDMARAAGGDYAVLEKAAHSPNEEAPGATADLLTSFAAIHPAR